jgi:D-alanyl-D-alanine carboxypeptidase
MPSDALTALHVAIRVFLLVVYVGLVAPPRTAVAGPALLFDSNDGKVLYAEDQDDVWYPASLTKMMTAYLTFEALKQCKVGLDTKLTQSELSHSQPPSKIGMPIGAQMDVELALQSLIIKSANDVAVMLAEGIGGSQEAFVERMNVTAKRLGMMRTNFANPNGLPDPRPTGRIPAIWPALEHGGHARRSHPHSYPQRAAQDLRRR